MGPTVGAGVFEYGHLSSLLSSVPALLCPPGKHHSSVSSEPQGGGREPGLTLG